MKKLFFVIAILLGASMAAYSQAPRNPNNRNYLQQVRPTAAPNPANPTGSVNATPPQADSVSINFIGLAGASAGQDLKSSSSAAVSLGISVAWGNHKKDDEYRYYHRFSAYLLFNPKAVTSNDSASKQKTFLFPEMSNRSLVAGFERILPISRKSDLNALNNGNRPCTLSWFAEFSTGTYDTGVNKFQVFDLAAGFKFNFHNQFAGLPFGVQIAPNYSLINVEAKDWNAMDMSLLGASASSFDLNKDKGVPATVHAIGVNCKISVSAFEIFGNFKYLINDRLTNNPNIPADLKGTVAVFGIIIDPDIWGFNVPWNKAD